MASAGGGPEQPGQAPPPGQAPAAQPSYEGGTSGKAIAALVFGLLAFLVWPLGIVGIILGVMARRDISARPGLGGNGLAIAGIVLSIIFIVLGVIGAAILLS